MSSSSANILFDNLRYDVFSYQGSWTTSSADQWFNSSMSSTNSSNSSVTFTFHGTAVAFMGLTPVTSAPQSFLVSIDNSTAFNVSFADPNPPSYRQWYQSPTLADGTHTITLSSLVNSSIDYAQVTVGPTTYLGGEKIVVDDKDTNLRYSSSGWTTDKDKFLVGGTYPATGFTLGNSTHLTSHVGSWFSYKFSGRTLNIYGIYDFSSTGYLSLSVSIDSQSLPVTFQVTSSSPQLLAEVGQQPNAMISSFDFLTSGEHTLLVNVTQCINQTFRFDYLTYLPTFATLSDMPSDLTSGSGDSGSTSGSGSGSGGGHKKVGTIVGASVGVVVGSLLLGVLLFVYIRHRARRRKNSNNNMTIDGWGNKETTNVRPEPFPRPNDHSTSPLLMTASTSQMNSGSSAALPVAAGRESALGPMAMMQNTSAAQYGLNFPHTNQQLDVRPQPSDSSGGPESPPSYDEVTSTPR